MTNTQNSFDCVMYMVPLENGLAKLEWQRVLKHFVDEQETVAVQVSANNTTMIGLLKNECEDIKDDIIEIITPICDDWNFIPDGVVSRTETDITITTLAGITIKILCDWEMS